MLKFIVMGETFSILGWLTGVLFIPSLALTLGMITGSSKAFEALYVSWMYTLTKKFPGPDFAGMTPEAPIYLYAPLAIALLALALFARQTQLTKR